LTDKVIIFVVGISKSSLSLVSIMITGEGSLFYKSIYSEYAYKIFASVIEYINI